MKLALFLPDFRGGGAQKMMLNLAEALGAIGHEVVLVVARAEGPFRLREGASVRLVDLGCSRTISAVAPLASFLRAERPDVLLSALFNANIAAILGGLLAGGRRPKIVVTERNYFSARVGNSDRLADRFYPFFVRLLYRFADKVVGISDGVTEDVRRVAGIPQARVCRIYNPVVTEDFDRLLAEDVADEWLDDPERPVIVTSGRFVPQKDYFTLLKAFAELRKESEAGLLVLGHGPLQAELEEVCESLAIRDDVHFVGFVENPLAYLRKASLFVMASRWEGFCNVIVEALYCGLPVVATDCPSGPAEILEGGRYGRLVPVGDVDALARALADGLAEEPDREALRDRAHEFSADRIAREFEALFIELVGLR
ncbi:MAG: glycosyltransferase [Alphaproteobacteria bacterium]|nr:glycosyltransferase [Alphaproteobacteria bacterium]